MNVPFIDREHKVLLNGNVGLYENVKINNVTVPDESKQLFYFQFVLFNIRNLRISTQNCNTCKKNHR